MWKWVGDKGIKSPKAQSMQYLLWNVYKYWPLLKTCKVYYCNNKFLEKKSVSIVWIYKEESNANVTLGIKVSFCFFYFIEVLKNRWSWGQCKVLYSINGLSCDKLNVIHIWVHTVFWLFCREVAFFSAQGPFSF